MSDVKELTPEFFYCPEIFLNSNKLPLGEMQVRTSVRPGIGIRWPVNLKVCIGRHHLPLSCDRAACFSKIAVRSVMRLT